MSANQTDAVNEDQLVVQVGEDTAHKEGKPAEDPQAEEQNEFSPDDDLRCKCLICCRCMNCLCRLLNVTPFFSMATFCGMMAMIFETIKLYNKLEEDFLDRVFVVSDTFKGWLGFGVFIIAGSMLVNMFVALHSWMSSPFFLKQCCHEDERVEGCRKCCKSLTHYVHWTFLFMSFVCSYIATIVGFVLTMFCMMLPILAGLCYGACAPIYDGAKTLAETSLNELFVVIKSAMDDGVNENFKSIISEVDLTHITDAQTLDFCNNVFPDATSNSGWLLVCCIALVVMQVNFAIISRGNLVSYTAHERIERKHQNSFRLPNNEASAKDGETAPLTGAN